MRRGIVGSILLVLLAAVSARGDAGAEALAQAAGLEKEGRFDEAAALYEKRAQEVPAAVVGLSRTLVRLGRAKDAEKVVVDALAKWPADASLILARAEARLVVCDTETAAKTDESKVMGLAYEGSGWVQKALVKDQKSFALRLLKARYDGFISRDTSDAARKTLVDLTVENPKSADAWCELGRHYARRTKDQKDAELWGKSEEAYTKALDADKMRGDAWVNLGRAKGWLDRDRGEIAGCFEKAAMLLAGDPNVIDLLAKWSPTPREYLDALKRIAAHRTSDRIVRLALATAIAKQKTFREGMNILDKAAAEAPKDAWVAFDRALFCVAQLKVDLVVPAALAAVGVAKEAADRNVYSQLDGVALSSGLSAEQRERIWAALFEAFPNEVEVPNNAAVWFRDKGHDFAKSADWYERALSVAKDDVMLLNDTGLVWWFPNYLNNPEKAEPYFRRAIAAAKAKKIAHPDKSIGYRDAVDNLAKLLEKAKRTDDLRALAAEIPDDPRSAGIRGMADAIAASQKDAPK